MVGTCENTVSDLGRNPWNPDRTPGGSSAGAAAAVAAGLCPAATGSDGGGSIRIPAHFCGIYGIKPTMGRVSGYSGVSGPPMPNIFSQNGPLTRTVGDAALLLQILAGHDPRDPVSLRDESPDFVAATERDIKGLRVAWSPDFGFAQVHADVIEVTSAAVRLFEGLGCHVEEPGFVFPEPYDTFGPVFTADCYTNYGACLETHADQLTPHAHFHFDKGAAATTADYARALGEIGLLKAKVADLFESYDLIMSPTACFPAFEYGEFPGEVSGQSSYPDQYWNGGFTCPINASGNPAASVPAGFSSEGLPIGLHIIGKKGDEETVIAASTAFERARPWIHHRPRIS